MTFANINLNINFSALVPYVSAKLDLKTRNIFSCTALVTDLLDRVSNAVKIDPGNLSSTGLCIKLLSHDDSHFSLDTNRFIIESGISFIKSTSHFKQI